MSGNRGSHASDVYDVELEKVTSNSITHGRKKEETHDYWAWKEIDARA